jgi:small subunit ribosomal protein S12
MNPQPQFRGVCLLLKTISPKKPNSANRRVAQLRLRQKDVFVKIPGEKHQLVTHSLLLIRPAKIRDLIGVQHVAIRGKLDLVGVKNRKRSRSKYGVKKTTT